MILTLKTHLSAEFIDITPKVQSALAKAGVLDGFCLVYVPHTTAGITINENADPDVRSDVLMALDRMVPEKGGYRHGEGNSPAHVKASLMGASAHIAIEGGKLVLGTWQGIFFCEFDGPRTRKVHVHIMEGNPVA